MKISVHYTKTLYKIQGDVDRVMIMHYRLNFWKERVVFYATSTMLVWAGKKHNVSLKAILGAIIDVISPI